ncbi:MAG: rod shape-determining protein RodA [Candidatus Hydrogenedentes bacterium]|nr:rod shape-determining protein RodA [Candidatus Hydrogenedentota bacterium]
MNSPAPINNKISTFASITGEDNFKLLDFRKVKNIDPLLSILAIALVVIGWLNMFSASEEHSISYFYKHLTIFFITLPIVFLLTIIDYKIFVSISPVFYIISIIILVGIFGLGIQVKGSERWYELGALRFQPSEINKILLVLTLTWYFKMVEERIRKFWWYAMAFVITAIPAILILLQPNLGTAVSLIPIVIFMLLIGGCKIWHWVATILAGFIVIVFLYLEISSLTPEKIRAGEHPPYLPLKPHQLMRIYSFFNPDADIKGSGWQTYQSKITIGSGGIYGKGFRKGTQSRLNYLPEYHTDFIFSHFAEENGFYKSLGLLILYLLLLIRMLTLAYKATEYEGKLLIVGVTAIFFFHISVNIGITMGLLPVTGLPLPFLSYGRSFYLTCMVAIGLIFSVPKQKAFLFKVE